MTRFDPAGYPGRRPAGPVLVWRGAEHALDPHDLDAPGAAGAPVLHDPDRRWLLAYGSNASPDRLIGKRLDRNGALLLPARAIGWTTAWEARLTQSAGAVPLSLIPAAGRILDTWVLGAHPDDLDDLDRGEGRGQRYELGVVGDVAVAARWHLPGALAYGPGRDTRVLLDGPSPATFPEVSQADARRLYNDEAPGRPVAQLPDAVPRPRWPATPLGDLDLFVYGTLQPGDVRWPSIADHVEPVGPATTTGTVWSTPMRWPAAIFGADAGTLHGTLLRPRSAAAARTLYRTADEVEGAVGDALFVRVAVRVSGPNGPGWAAAYAWNHEARGHPPGTVIPDGSRWRGA